MIEQMGALPLRWNRKGKLRVLLVTTRETRRWVVPKGWPMVGKAPWHAAQIEALEEAGVVGFVSSHRIGQYCYVKRLSDRTQRCRVSVYPMLVTHVRDTWPEHRERKRKWFSLKKAAQAVGEPELSLLLTDLRKKPYRFALRREFGKAV